MNYRVRADTVAFLKWLDEQDLAVSAKWVAQRLGLNDITLRRKMVAMKDAGLLRMEERRVLMRRGTGHRNSPIRLKPDTEMYFWIGAKGREILEQHPAAKATEPRFKIVNSVFALGDNHADSNQ